ncbi:MAG: hypothetical protein AAGJ70_04020, partial [Pseudomonadota bacterium]
AGASGPRDKLEAKRDMALTLFDWKRCDGDRIQPESVNHRLRAIPRLNCGKKAAPATPAYRQKANSL